MTVYWHEIAALNFWAAVGMVHVAVTGCIHSDLTTIGVGVAGAAFFVFRCIKALRQWYTIRFA